MVIHLTLVCYSNTLAKDSQKDLKQRVVVFLFLNPYLIYDNATCLEEKLTLSIIGLIEEAL